MEEDEPRGGGDPGDYIGEESLDFVWADASRSLAAAVWTKLDRGRPKNE